MVITFRTHSGSVYEVDISQKRFRRLYGTSNPTKYIGKDSEWKEYISVSDVEVGRSVILIWSLDDGILKTTQTSDVVKIIHQETND